MGKKRLKKWYDAANKRRGDLIHRKAYDNLTPEEMAELESLQEKCLAEVNRVHPPPDMTELDAKLDSLERRLG
jgi:hypothetical protein